MCINVKKINLLFFWNYSCNFITENYKQHGHWSDNKEMYLLSIYTHFQSTL